MMKRLLFIFLLCFSINSFSQTISYTESQFNSDTCCWRLLSAQKKYAEAAGLIVQYLNNNSQIKNKHSLNWHAGQMFAMAGNKNEAIKYFNKTYSFLSKVFSDEDGKQWYYYAKGTVAFIKRDKEQLNRILNKWKAKYAATKNYLALRKLYDKWDEDYETASK